MLVPIQIFLCEHAEFHTDQIDLKEPIEVKSGQFRSELVQYNIRI